MQALGPARGTQRAYSATMPAALSGPVAIDLVGQASSVLVLRVAPKADALRSLTDRRARDEYEPPVSENDPIYFVLGARSGYSARFQLSFKYRLFDQSRSEEHTSELQSLAYLVCRLLLEKKKEVSEPSAHTWPRQGPLYLLSPHSSPTSIRV